MPSESLLIIKQESGDGDPREGPHMHVPIVQGQFNYSSSCTVVVKISFFVYSGGGGGGRR
jgi:hypothetical protein